MDHALGPDQFTPEKLRDPTIHELIDKTTVAVDPGLVGLPRREAIVEIETNMGEKYSEKDHWRRPMPDEFLEGKFRLCCSRLMIEDRIEKVIKTCYTLQSLDDIGQLMQLLAF